MNKLENSEIENENPTIAIDTNIIKEIQKVFKENFCVLLTKTEQQLLKILYYEKSAMNVYEIRRQLIFSTIYHIIEQNKLFQNKEITENKKDFFFTKKEFIELLKEFSSTLNLELYENYPYFEFSKASASNFPFIANQILKQEQINKTPKDELGKVRYPPAYTEIPYIFKNKTQAENICIKILKAVNIEIYGFKTISDALDNLKSMKVIFTREIKIGKSKKAFSLNPILIPYIKE